MTSVLLAVILSSCGTALLIGYAAGARAAYWRGVARGQHAAGRTHMHVMAHALHGAPLPEADPADLDDGKDPGPN